MFLIKLLIFDLDGTLIDSADDIIKSVNELLIERGRERLPAETIRAAIGEGLKRLVAKVFPESETAPALADELEVDLKRFYSRHLLESTRPYAGVTEFLHRCEVPIALVTNKYELYTKQTLKGLGWDVFPWVCVYGSDSLARRKPDPLPLQEAMRLAHATPEETLMIGDGLPDMMAAQRAGVRAVACTYGYTAAEKLLAFKPAAELAHFSDLPVILSKLGRPRSC